MFLLRVVQSAAHTSCLTVTLQAVDKLVFKS